jgi:hypothetical protein
MQKFFGLITGLVNATMITTRAYRPMPLARIYPSLNGKL